jgi:acetyltransferase
MIMTIQHTTILQITHDTPEFIEALSALLIDSVENGASVGFLSPLSPDTAWFYWQNTLKDLGADLMLWVAMNNDQVVGSVQLSLSTKENGQHRAEVQKLFVLKAYRSQGVASLLMKSLEEVAKENARTLLFLDTQVGSDAEIVYQRLGWQHAGEIPDFAADPNGQLRATAFYYKKL